MSKKEELSWDERAEVAAENAGKEGVDLEAELADVRRPHSDTSRGAFGLPGGFVELDEAPRDEWRGKATKGANATRRQVTKSTKTGGKAALHDYEMASAQSGAREREREERVADGRRANHEGEPRHPR